MTYSKIQNVPVLSLRDESARAERICGSEWRDDEPSHHKGMRRCLDSNREVGGRTGREMSASV